MSDLPDYYAILEVTETATQEQIRTAYKKAALKWHPDRVPTDSPEKASRTKKFQRINDAYYTLSSEERRREYDETRKWHSGTSSTFEDDDDEDAEEIPRSGFGSWFSGGKTHTKTDGEKFADQQFGGIFEEMMGDAGYAEEGTDAQGRTKRFWSVAGGISGGVIGFIIGNFFGAATGVAAGSSLGHIRDQKGKSVYEVFNELDQDSKAKILTELAAKMFSGAIS